MQEEIKVEKISSQVDYQKIAQAYMEMEDQKNSEVALAVFYNI